MSVRYQHTQIGWLTIVTMGVLEAFLVALCAWRGEWAPLLFSTVMLALVVSQMYRMTVTVADGKVVVTSGTGHLRKVVSLDEVTSCEPVKNRWYYGWGLRGYPDGWIINVSGLDAVELKYRGGGALRIGTDEPWQLCDAIQAELETVQAT